MEPEEIQKRIEKSTAIYKARIQATIDRKEYLKKGRKILRQNIYNYNAKLYKVELYNGYKIAIVTWNPEPKNKKLIRHYTYAICSPKDTWSDKIAKGLLGHRTTNSINFYITTSFQQIQDIMFLTKKILEKFILVKERKLPLVSNYPNKLASIIIREIKEDRQIIKTINTL